MVHTKSACRDEKVSRTKPGGSSTLISRVGHLMRWTGQEVNLKEQVPPDVSTFLPYLRTNSASQIHDSLSGNQCHVQPLPPSSLATPRWITSTSKCLLWLINAECLPHKPQRPVIEAHVHAEKSVRMEDINNAVAWGNRATEMEIASCVYYLNNLPPFAAATLEGKGN